MSTRTPSQRGASRRSTPAASGKAGAAKRATPRAGKAVRAKGAAPSSTRGRARVAPRRAPSRSRRPARPAGPWLPIGILIVLALLGWSLYPVLRVQYQTSRRVAGLEEQYRSLRERNEALRAEAADLKTPEGVERAARESLGFTKQGENVYIVTDSGTPSAPLEAGVAGAQRTPAQVVLDAIFGVAPPPSPEREP